jgi:hypothetical protein
MVLLLVAVLLVTAFAYERGKKCGAWQSRHSGAKEPHALLSKPLGCWRLH